MRKFVFAILITISLCLVGCSEVAVLESEKYNQFKKNEVEISSLAEYPLVVLVAENTSQIIYQIVDAGVEREQQKWKLYSYDKNSNRFTALEIERSAELEKKILYGCMNEEGKLFISYEDEILIYNETYELEDTIQLEHSDFTGNNLLRMECDDKFIYLMNKQLHVQIMDYNMNVLLHEKDGMFILCPNSSKQCILVGEKKKSVGVCNFDESKKELVKKKEIHIKQEKEGDMMSYDYIEGDGTYDFYYYDTSLPQEEVVLTGYKDGENIKILNFVDLGIYPKDIRSICPDNYGGFVIVMCNPQVLNGTVDKIVVLEPADIQMTESQEEKVEITFAGIGITDQFQRVVFDFNAYSDKYKIICKDYSVYNEDFENARKALNLDVLKVDEIDGILLNTLVKSELVQKGVLSDLNPYFEKSDIIAKESLQESVLDAMTEESGEIYTVYPEFILSTTMSKVGNDLSNLSEYKSVLSQGKAIFTQQDPTILLGNLLYYSGDKFLKTKQAFVEEEFKELLEMIKMQADLYMVDTEESEQFIIANDKAIFIDKEIEFPYEYLFYSYLFDGEFLCSNYGIAKPVLQPGVDEIGIMESSDKKEGIYAFLDYLFTEENYVKYFGDIHFPVLKSIYADKIKEMTATEEYVDRFGNIKTPRDFDYGINDISVLLGRMTKEQEQGLNKLLADAVYVEPMKEEYLEIIEEEAQFYFEEKKSLDEVCQNIQNRMSNALSE